MYTSLDTTLAASDIGHDALLEFTTDIERALAHDEFDVAYQPQFATSSGRLVGYEALIRWNSPEHGMIPPSVFIPQAERTGQICEIGAWVLRRSCRDLATMMDRAHQGHRLHVAINVSPIQLNSQDVIGLTRKALAEYRLSPQHVHMELTETAMIDHLNNAADTIGQLKDFGIQIWIDDFGTGYASLRMLRQLAIAGIKIDRSFVGGLDNEDDFSITSAIVAMAQRLRLTVVAEGVETEEQLQILSQLGCDRVQGYLLGRPAPFDQLLCCP